ncbi:MAG: hypothetical protein JEZ07_02815 [Phycisphaerae bacterium]|nr:hypothetical protein [Phycisphaerae bacterium]
MLEYRHNLLTDQWVIIAAKRDDRPQSFTAPDNSTEIKIDPACPFCLGNEHLTATPVYLFEKDSQWLVRVIPNKFPFLNRTRQNYQQTDNTSYLAEPADGIHEVLIESNKHSDHLAIIDYSHALEIIKALQSRCRDMLTTMGIGHVCIFKNHGRDAGASLVHPHFQIAAASLISPVITARLLHCQQFIKDKGISTYQAVIQEEINADKRIITQDKDFIIFCPYASQYPYEVCILPMTEIADFSLLTKELTEKLTANIQTILKKLYRGLNNPPYNIIIDTVPNCHNPAITQGFRFMVRICPRITPVGGYETATSTYVNTTSPEAATDFFQSI